MVTRVVLPDVNVIPGGIEKTKGNEILSVDFENYSEMCKIKIHESNTEPIQYLST